MNWNPATGWLLVVEDNLDIWTVLKAVLPMALPGVSVVHAIDASAALTYLQHSPTAPPTCPRLILQNLYLPERTDGLALISRFKAADSACRQTPVVVMSSSTDPADSNDAVRSGARSYLVKPNGVAEWIQVLRTLRHYWEEQNDRSITR